MEDLRTVDAAIDELLSANPPACTDVEEFLGRQFDAGLAWVHLPRGEGGLSVRAHLQEHVRDRLLAAGAPSAFERNSVGHGMAAPTIVRHGSDEQRRRYLRPLFTGLEHWCQLFSEPGAGSDLAGVSTRAVRDGDEWIVNGQKVWTTRAHRADKGILLARTDPDVPKHRGLTFFVVDMHAQGVDVRPLRQITGDCEFNEVFLSDVRVPDIDRLGAVGEGWRVAVTTLMNERVFVSSSPQPRGSGPIGTALELWRRVERTNEDSPLKERLVRLWTESELTRLTSLRANERSAGDSPGPQGSIVKLASTESFQRIYELCMDLLGAEALTYDSYEEPDPQPSVQRAYLRSLANTIEGGTSEVQRNILAERVLRLPPEPRQDKEIAWSRLPRG